MLLSVTDRKCTIKVQTSLDSFSPLQTTAKSLVSERRDMTSTKKRTLLTVDDIKPSLRGTFYTLARLWPRFVALSFFLSFSLSLSFALEIESIVGIESQARCFVFSARKYHHLTPFLSLSLSLIIKQQANGYQSCGQKLASGTTRKCSQWT